jgi:hypothetical protein
MNSFGYLLTMSLSLGLLLAFALSWSDATRGKLKVSRSWLILALCAVLVVTWVRIIPGGPFLSIHSDILPVAGCAVLFAFATMSLRTSSPAERVLLLFAMLGSVALIGLVVVNVISFWRDPFARGELVGW